VRNSGRAILARFGAVLLRVPRYLHLAYRLARDSRLPRGQRALVTGGVAYLVSPIDPIPGIIPVVGQLDDLAILLLSLRRVLRTCPSEVAEEQLQASGVTLAAIEADLATVRATGVWVAIQSGRAVSRAARGIGHVGRRLAAGALERLGSGRRAADDAARRSGEQH